MKIKTNHNIWSAAENKDFQSILNYFSQEGLQTSDMGEALLSLANMAIEANKISAAINLLVFLIEALEDKSEAEPLIKKVADLYFLSGDYTNARDFFGRLPLTFENVTRVVETFLPVSDVDGLILFRNSIIQRIDTNHHSQIHLICNDALESFFKSNNLFERSKKLFKKNQAFIKNNPPLIFGLKTSEWKPEAVCFNGCIYAKQNNIWQKIAIDSNGKNTVGKKIQSNSNIMVFCESFYSFSEFLKRIQSDAPLFIKYECRVILDFNLLSLFVSVFDFTVLENCDFVIRFMNKDRLEVQLKDLLLKRKLPFTNRVIFISDTDEYYFSKKVIPILKKCEDVMTKEIELFEQQLKEIFPLDYYKKTLKKIEARKKLRIIFFTSRFTTYMQYSTRDIAEGFRQLGHEILIEIEDEDSGVSIRKDVCMENLINFKPDIIFSINHLRFSYPWVPKSIPFVTWVQDLMPHLITLSDHDLVSHNDYIFSFSQHLIDNGFSKHPVLKNKAIHCLPVTIDEKIYRPLPSYRKKYDVSFITHLPHPDQTLLPLVEGKMIPEIRSEETMFFAEHLIKKLEIISIDELHELFADETFKETFIHHLCKDLNICPTEDFYNLLRSHDKNHSVSRFQQHFLLLMKTKPVKALLENNIDIRVFGKNWEKLPLFKDIAMGIAPNGKELNKIINQSKINLNMSAGTSYHMKAPEVIAAKAFMFSRRIARRHDAMPITNFFKEGKEIILVKNEQELVKKSLFFLKNKNARDTIAQAAYEKFINNYNVKNSANFILQIIASRK